MKISLEHFIELKPLISEEWLATAETLRLRWTIPLLRFWFHSCDELNKRRENEPERFQKTATSESCVLHPRHSARSCRKKFLTLIGMRLMGDGRYYMKMTIILKEISIVMTGQLIVNMNMMLLCIINEKSIIFSILI